METASWVGVAMAFVALVGTVAKQVLDNRKAGQEAEAKRNEARDKLEFDAKVARLESAVAACEEDRTEMKGELAANRQDLADCHDRHRATDSRVAKLERIVGVKPGDDTAEHTPLPPG